MTLFRRDILRGALLLATPMTPFLSGCSSDDEKKGTEGPTGISYVHGVASGDPLPDAVILWTRVTVDDGASVDVEWEVFEDTALTKKVASGKTTTNADRDFTVKVDATGLAANHTYYYRFKTRGTLSPVGRTKTAPSGKTDRVRFAVVSCSSFAHGYFHGYRALAGHLDLDAVLHLGDYIYEYGNGQYGDVRNYEPPTEILSLSDYRTRHSQYKRDPDLQEVHRQHPFITIWDDHEVANDGYKNGAENHQSDTEGPWADRKAAGLRAYREWMPIREQSDPTKIFRKLAYGDLVDIVLLDTRYWGRTQQATTSVIGSVPTPDPARTLLGDDQAQWMEDTLKGSTAHWKLLAQQVMLGNLNLGGGQIANFDQWQGYPESRTRFLNFLKTSGLKDVVVVTGDIHSSWANEIVIDPLDKAQYDPATGQGSLCVEMVTTAITSPGIPANFQPLLTQAKPQNPQIRWFDSEKRGFIILDITPERAQGAWHLFEDITQPAPQTPAFAKAWSVKSGETRLNEEPAAAPDRDGAPPAAPA
jgi:alkaline phosphatase D